jgi:hypothetical protein
MRATTHEAIWIANESERASGIANLPKSPPHVRRRTAISIQYFGGDHARAIGKIPRIWLPENAEQQNAKSRAAKATAIGNIGGVE